MNKSLGIKGQLLKAYCCSFFKTVGQPTEPRWSSLRLTRQDSSSLETTEAWVKGSRLPLLQGLPAEIPCYQRKTRSHRCDRSLSGVFLVAPGPPAFLPSIFSFCLDPELPCLLLPHEALIQQKSFWKPKENEAGSFPCTCFPFLLPFPGLYLVSPQWENLRRKGWDKGERQRKAKRDRWGGAWEKPTGTAERRGKSLRFSDRL